MKTVMLCNLIPLKMGAFEKLVIEMGKVFKREGDELVFVFAGRPCAELDQAMRELSIGVHIIPEWCDVAGREKPWGFIRAALLILEKENPAIVGIHFGNELPSLTLAMFLRMRTGHSCQWVWQQQQQIADPGFLARHLSRIRCLSFGFDHFVPVYEGGRLSLLKRGIPTKKITVITNATNDYHSTLKRGWLRDQFAIAPDTALAVTVGSLIARKRIDFLLRVLSRMNQDASRLHLVMVGDGPEKEALGAQAAALGISERVHWMGKRNDVRDILAECDLMVHSATAEASAFSILEGMAAGLPVVVTAAGAAKEQIEEGVNGFVIGLDDEEGFVRSVHVLMHDQQLRQRMGAAGRERWERLYRLEAAAEQYHALYKTIAKK